MSTGTFGGSVRRVAPRPGSRLVTEPAQHGHRAPVRTLGCLLGSIAFLTLALGPMWKDSPSRLYAARSTPSDITPVLLASATETVADETCDERHEILALRAQLVGAWEDDHMGRRVMTLRPDGTGTMLVELKGPAKLLIGPRLLFTLTWSVDERTLSLQMTGDEPAKKVAMITRRYGDKAEQHIEEIDGQWLYVHDLDDGDEFAFRRLEPTITLLD